MKVNISLSSYWSIDFNSLNKKYWKILNKPYFGLFVFTVFGKCLEIGTRVFDIDVRIKTLIFEYSNVETNFHFINN